jgi:TP901 family phage tail tape measure protein
MGDRLSKEIILEIKSVVADMSAIDTVSARLTAIENQIQAIHALASKPITMSITPPVLPTGFPTSGGLGGGATGSPLPSAPPSPLPTFAAPNVTGAFDPATARETQVVITQLANGMTNYARTLTDAWGNTQTLNTKTQAIITTSKLATESLAQLGVVKNVGNAFAEVGVMVKKADAAIESASTRARNAMESLRAKTQGRLLTDKDVTQADEILRKFGQMAPVLSRAGEAGLAGFQRTTAELEKQVTILRERRAIEEQATVGIRRGVGAVSVAGEAQAIEQRVGAARAFMAVGQAAEGTVAVGAGFDAAGAATRRYSADAAEMNRVLEQNRTNFAALREAGFESVGKSIQQTSSGLAVMTEKFQTADGRIAHINYTTGQFSMQMEKANKETRSMGDSIGHTVGKVFLWAISTAVIYAPLRAMATLKDEMIAVDYQSGRLQRVFAGTTSELAKLKTEAIALGGSLGIVPSQAIETAVSIARLQQDRVRTLEMLRVALLAQNVAELSVEDSLKFTTAAILQFNLNAFQAIRVLDAWNALSNQNRVLTSDLGDAVSIAGRAFLEAGANIETLNAYTTALTQTMGQTGNMIGTALRTIAVYAQNVRKAGIATQITGVEIMDAFGNMMPLGEIISRLAATFDELSDAERNTLADAIAGVRRRTQLLVLLQQYPDVLRAMGQQYESANSAIREQEVLSRTLQFQLSRLNAEFRDIGVSLGEGGVLNVLKTTVTTIRLVVGAFGSTHVAAQILTAALTALAARFVLNEAIWISSRRTVDGLSGAVSILTARFYALATAEKVAGAALSFVGGLAAGVVKLVVFMLAISGVTKALDFLYEKIGAFRTATSLEERIGGIQTALNKLETLKAAVANVQDVIGAIKELNTIEASGEQLTEGQQKLKDAATAYVETVLEGVYTHQEIVKLLETEIGQEKILAELRSRTTTSEKQTRGERNKQILDTQMKALELEEEIQAREKERARAVAAGGKPVVEWRGIEMGRQSFDEWDKRTAALKVQREALQEEIRELRKIGSPDVAKLVSEEEELNLKILQEYRKEIRETLKELEKFSSRRVQIATTFAATDIEKVQIEIKKVTELLDELTSRAKILEKQGFAPGSKEEVKFEELTDAIKKTKSALDDLEAKEIEITITKNIKEQVEDLKDALDFRIEVSNIVNKDALGRAAAKYAIIRDEVTKINAELSRGAQSGKSQEEITAMRMRLVELEKEELRAAKDVQLERLRTEVEIGREMQKQLETAEQNYLFADREAQAKARALAFELQKRGGERLSAEEFVQFSPDVRNIIKDMVPGLLPIEALSEQLRKGLGVPTTQLSLDTLMGLPQGPRGELRDMLPGAIPDITVSADHFKIADIKIPFGPENVTIANIPVPTERFIIPPIEIPADRFTIKGAQTATPATNAGTPQVSVDTAGLDTRLMGVFDAFIAKQEKITDELANTFSNLKQAKVEMDVDVNFAGVQGPLNNLVSTFSGIVERRLNERIDALASQLKSALSKPSTPNVRAEAQF